MRILAIETSCDDTAAAVVEDGRRALSNVIASQIKVHRLYNGVVPELASRCHIEYMLPVVGEALRQAGSDESLRGIDAVAVTRGPGLVGSLLVGIETAKTLAWRRGLPLIAIHHTMGHLLSVFCDLPDKDGVTATRLLEIPNEDSEEKADWQTIEGEERESRPRKSQSPTSKFDFPYIGLAISGGHSSLTRVDSPTEVRLLGSTLDDAPGEAYDKVAKYLGLGYPGGPEVDRRAALGDPKAFDLPRPVLHSRRYDFSFSGLKTAVVRQIEDAGGAQEFLANGESALNDLCASFQAAVVDVLIVKAERALKDEKLRRLAVVGGVACNRGLRAEGARRLRGAHLVFPPPALCTDNAAMIGVAAAHVEPLSREAALRLDARAGWNIERANDTEKLDA